MPIWALYLVTVAIWGTSWYGIKEQLGVVAPTVSIAYRFLLAAAILWVFCLVSRRRVAFRPQDHLWMALQGLCLFCGNYILFYFAGMHLVSGLLAVCFSTMSLMNVVNVALFFRRPLDRNAGLAALVGLAGLALVFYPRFMEQNARADAVLGFALSMLATFLASHPGWQSTPPDLPLGVPRGTGVRFTPFHDGTDGFFIARLEKPC